MEAAKKTISDVFNGNRVLEIPFFQRSYVWEDIQWERLLEDMENITQNRQPYFLGSLILKQQPTSTSSSYGDRRIVIDGQQRLTTLNIFFKVLCLKADKDFFNSRFRLERDKHIALKHNHNDIEAFDKVMNLTELKDINRTDGISMAYTYFKEKIDPDKLDYYTIIDKVLFVVIDLTADEDEQQIFDTINSLGVKLTTAELLKNFLFDKDNIETYNTYWKNVFEKDEETKKYWDCTVTTGRLQRTFIDLFFYSFLQIKAQELNISVKGADYTRVDKLFDSYKRFVNNHYPNNEKKRELLEEIRKYALLFKETFGYDHLERELPATPGLERLNAIIFKLETTTLIPYILYISHNVTDENAKADLYEFIETYIMRRMVVKATTKNYNQLFTERLISNRILSKEDLMSFLNTQEDKVNYLPSDIELKEGFQESKLINNQAAGILYLIEAKIRDRSRHSTQLLGINKYSLEHIMPKKWENNWGALSNQQQKDVRNRKLLTLGNLTIITQTLNTSIRDADWNTKKVGRGVNKPGLKKYAEGIETLCDYLDFPEWNEGAIEKRAEYLYEKAIEVWHI